MKLRNTIRAIGIIAATSLLFIPMAQGSAQAKAKAPVYKLLWSDEFSRKLNHGPDPAKWTLRQCAERLLLSQDLGPSARGLGSQN